MEFELKMTNGSWNDKLSDSNSGAFSKLKKKLEEEFNKGTIYLRRRQIFHKFDPYLPTVGSFLVLSVGKFGKFLTPPPLEHADVLNGWSLIKESL